MMGTRKRVVTTAAVAAFLLIVSTVVLLGHFLAGRGIQAGGLDSDRSVDRDEATVVYFFSSSCPDCAEVEATVLPLLEESGQSIHKIDVDAPGAFATVRAFEERLGVAFEVLAPNMIVSGVTLKGRAAIQEYFNVASAERRAHVDRR